MAAARVIVELDGGGVIDVTERSTVPVTGGVQAALLTQEALRKVLGALGLAVAEPSANGDQAQSTPGVDDQDDSTRTAG